VKTNRFSFFRSLLFLERQSSPVLLTISILLIVLLGVIDYLTGFELSFSFFYLIPVSITAWAIGRNAGLVISVLSAITWVASNLIAGETYTTNFVAFWNTFMRLGFFSVVTMLTHTLHLMLEEERGLARTDPLTGALNRRAFYDIMAATNLLALRNQRPCTLVYLDVDNFKEINDQRGHITGDSVLKTLVSTIQENIRGSDFLARLGGDEFAALLTEADQPAAKLIIERLRDKLQEAMQAHEWEITFSIGVLTFTHPPASVSKMVGMTDQLMYQVKSNGKNDIMYSMYEEFV
jgi:diguanylate cyclase (GGDEF)-like protein